MIKKVDCGKNNGMVNGMASGGQGLLQYTLNNITIEPNTTVEGLSEETHQIIVADETGCQQSSWFNLPIDCRIYFPNACSPNGDGVNDYFRPQTSQSIDALILDFKIYNRAGGLVYEVKDLPIHSRSGWWDGTVNGQQASEGVYVYFMKVDFTNQKNCKILEGDITLIK